ncbi:MAG: T9SS type A sorting domain-containing protein, partial [Bacteroidales bacterium]|nr:T9SS type A sorting domain-containing protein [Bacteroidales bacterium]
VIANAQVFTSSFETWTGGSPNGWMGPNSSIEADSVNQITYGTQYGANAVQLVNTEGTHKRFTTQPMHVDGGTSYEIKFWVKGQGDIRTALFDTTWGTYNNYISVNTTTWTEQSQIVTASVNSDIAEFIISIRNTVGTDHIQIDSVAISTTTVPSVSIHDIQYTTIGDSPYAGQAVNTGGIVTGIALAGQFFVQAGPGAWDGIYVYDNQQTVAVGDSVTFTATVSEFNGLTELSGIANFVVVSTGNSLYAPVVITSGTMDEQYEGVLVKVNNANCTVADAGNGMWTIDDGSGAVNTDDVIFHFTATAGTHYDVTGIGYYSFGEFKILPRDANDITISSGIEDVNNESVISVFPNPAVNYFTIQTNQRIASVELFNVVGEKIHTFEGNLVNYSVSAYNSGVYFVKIYTQDGNVITKRIKLSK